MLVCWCKKARKQVLSEGKMYCPIFSTLHMLSVDRNGMSCESKLAWIAIQKKSSSNYPQFPNSASNFLSSSLIAGTLQPEPYHHYVTFHH